jgi:hypothetical protein
LWWEAFHTCLPEPKCTTKTRQAHEDWVDSYIQFYRLVNVGAYLDAALLLVPEDGAWIRSCGEGEGFFVKLATRTDAAEANNVRHPAVALLVAALAARRIR